MASKDMGELPKGLRKMCFRIDLNRRVPNGLPGGVRGRK